MPTFNFSSFKPKKKIQQTTIVLYDNIKAIVIVEEKVLKAKVGDNKYLFTNKSLSTDGCRVIYAKRLDKYGHRIKIIRDINNKEDIGSKFYCRLAPGLIVKGKVIRNEVNLELFQVTKVLNENDILSNSIDDKEWEINEI